MIERKLVCSVDCPFCGKSVNVVKETEVVIPAVKAEKIQKYIAEPDNQTTL